MPLKTVKNDTKSRAFCGPTAVCSITGAKVSKVRGLIQERRGPQV